MSEKKEKFIFIVAMAILLLVQVAMLVVYGNKKAGFHEDELYTYYSTNKTAGLFVNDREWLERDGFRNDFVVLPGEQFRYGIVKQMQSWDVHPPFYYYIFHTACSLFPGMFSKWLGIGVNLIAYVVSFLLLAYVAYGAVTIEVHHETQGKMLAFLTCFAWGFCSAVISGVMFIRMYQWLTLFVLLCLALHLRAVKRRDFRVRSFLLPLTVTVFLGFLTQYYYIIFHFFLGVGFCVFLLKDRRVKELAGYVVTCAAGLMGAILYYPASLSHIFRGYRGTEAVSEFGDMSNTGERLQFFYGLFDDFVMNGTLEWWLLVICLLAVTAGYLRKKGKGRNGFWNVSTGLMLFACGGYFFTVSKTALILGETSNRYQLPIYGILLFLILYALWELSAGIVKAVMTVKATGNGKIMVGMFGLMIGAVALIDAVALKNGRVFFLYEEEKDVMEYVRGHKEETVVVFYNDASPDNIWRLSDELMECERVYLASQGNKELIGDETIEESDRLLVYVADYDNKEECLRGILEVNGKLGSYREVAEKGLWTLYEFS